MYDLKGIYAGSITAARFQIKIMQKIWDKCNSGDYQCQYSGPSIGATYNCIGHALGITKWLNPGEITSYMRDGMSKKSAIETFLNDKKSIFKDNHQSNIAQIIDNLVPFGETEPSMKDNLVAFFFNSSSNSCLHGARYVESFSSKSIGWNYTSKLGEYITISHQRDDLLGGVYGDALLS